jgi:uncharacterized RDD family membrane protein YckC
MRGSQPRREPTLDLVTPEGFPLSFAIAGPIERLFALLMDLALLGIALVAVVVVMVLAGLALGSQDIWAIGLFALFVLRHGYFAYFEIFWHGETPAKRAFGIRVVSRDGSGLGADAVLARNIMRDIELFLPLAAVAAPSSLVGPSPAWLWAPALSWVALLALLPLSSRERTRAGDLIAGTIVVRVPPSTALADEAAPTSVGTRRALEFSREQLSIYGEHELETLADVLRKAERGQADNFDLLIIARTIAAKIHYAGGEQELDPQRFLRIFYRAQRASLEKKLLLGKRKASKFDAG